MILYVLYEPTTVWGVTVESDVVRSGAAANAGVRLRRQMDPQAAAPERRRREEARESVGAREGEDAHRRASRQP